LDLYTIQTFDDLTIDIAIGKSTISKIKVRNFRASFVAIEAQSSSET